MNKIMKWGGLGFISLLAILSISVFSPSQKALAASQTNEDAIIALKGLPQAGNMVNMGFITIDIGGTEYIFEDTKPFDNKHHYSVTNNGTCHGEIAFADGIGPIGGIASASRTGVLGGATLDMDYLPEGSDPDNCLDVSTGNFPIGISASGNNVWFEYIDDSTIRDLDDNTYVPATSEGTDSRLWKREGVTDCALDLLIVEGSSLKLYKLTSNTFGKAGDGLKAVNATDRAIIEPLFRPGCKVGSTLPWAEVETEWDGTAKSFPIGDARTNGLPQGVGGLPGDPNDGSIGADCYTGLKSSFSWLVCPTLGFIDDFIGWAEKAISTQLTVDLGTQNTRDKLQESWTIVARFASGILVAIALVMVIATALGSDLVSPYALKKVLPRLVIGAIGIWLSWALVSTYIDIMNDLGKGIAGVMLSPFAEARNFSLQNIAGNAGAATAGGSEETVFVALATAGIISAGIFGLLGLGLSALFAFLVAIVVLALRQAVIIFLIILAPLGFAMWILPNTQKIWKLWSGTLNKLLLMYPMIMALLAAGKIFAFITSESINDKNSPEERFFGFAISLIAYVAPYFFLPALFKAAGGLFSNLTGMVNDRGKGLFDKSRGFLDKKKANSYREMAKNTRTKARDAQRLREYANDLTDTGVRGSYRRLRAGGLRTSNRRDVLTTASSAARATADKELESALSGDSGALKAVAYGDFKEYESREKASIATDLIKGNINAVQAPQRKIALEESVAKAQKLAGKHQGNRHSQAAALMQLANMGQAGEGEFKAVADAFGTDTTTAATVIGAAKQAAKSKGSLSAGAITYQNGKVGYINATGAFVPTSEPGLPGTPAAAAHAAAATAKKEAVAQIVRSLSSDGYSQLSIDTSKGPGNAKFRDSGVEDYFKVLPRSEQVDLLNNPSIRIPPSVVESMYNAQVAAATAAGVAPPPPIVYDSVAKVWG